MFIKGQKGINQQKAKQSSVSILSPRKGEQMQTQLKMSEQQRQSSINIHMLQSVISSNQDIIKSQSQQIRHLHMELIRTEDQLEKYKKKCVQLEEHVRLMANSEELTAKLADLEALEKQIHGLESELIETKLELAIKSSDSLQKDAVIRDLNQKNRLLDEEMQKMSVISSGTDTNSNSEDRVNNSNTNNINKMETRSTFSMIQVNKDNLQQFIEPQSQSNESIFRSLKNIIDSEIFKKNITSQTIIKIWQKQICQHILPKPKRFSFTSTYNKEVHLQKFLKQTLPLLKKYHGIPHTYRNKVWPFVTQDRLGISNALYIELIERRSKGWVAEKIKLQIERDILRSFNGEGSKDKLLKIFEIGLTKSKSESEDKSKFTRGTSVSIVGQTQLLEGSGECQKSQPTQDNPSIQSNEPPTLDTSKSLQIPLHLQVSSPSHRQSNFRIAEDVTQVLQLFYIYRPDIGFVQGMTYPAIMLTLAAGKFNSFRILCNMLLCSEFFRKMITFEPNFINYFCRIFDQLLLSYNLNLYNRVVRQFDIRSEVFLVDWFFTFFSRGITPITILRVWDLLLYQSCLNPKLPELVMYRLSLIIFELLEPILMQANYQECIRTIREYARKLDQEELIRRLYDSMKDSSTVKTFEQKYLKVKQRVEKRYEAEMQAI